MHRREDLGGRRRADGCHTERHHMCAGFSVCYDGCRGLVCHFLQFLWSVSFRFVWFLCLCGSRLFHNALRFNQSALAQHLAVSLHTYTHIPNIMLFNSFYTVCICVLCCHGRESEPTIRASQQPIDRAL